MSGVLGTQAYTRYFDHPQAQGYTQGAITASMPAGSLVGSLASSFIADRFSRKMALQVSCILWVIGSIIQCAAVDRGMLCAGRVIGGMFSLLFQCDSPVRESPARPSIPQLRETWLTGPRHVHRYRIQRRASIPIRDCSSGDPWSCGVAAAVGHHMGYPDPVLHPVWCLERECSAVWFRD